MLQGKSYSYCIEQVLGQGSFGITYLASVKMQGALGSIDAKVKVAVKEFFMKEINGREGTTVTSGSKGGLFADYRKKFIREATNLSKLQHPNIIKVLECFEANNTVYYTMEYLDGGSLDELISKKHGLSEAETVKYTMQIGNALSYMHEHKVLHLDLKPGNIMLSNGNAVLIDFGLSKQYDAGGNPESSTTVGAGTPGYAPIEQSSYRDGKGFPVTMDVYALGATMYKMLTSQRPPDASEVLNDGLPDKPASVSSEVWAAVITAMEPMHKNRPQTVQEWKAIMTSTALCVDDNNPEREEDTIVAKISMPSDVVQQQAKGIHNGHEWVDLGLSVKWSTCNVGAERVEDVGAAVYWGEARTKYCFNWIRKFYRLRVLQKMQNKFPHSHRHDRNIAPNSGHDTARENWGGTWRMPTVHEFVELVKRCKWKWTSQGGRNGYFITGPNGNSMFLPSNHCGKDCMSNLFFFGRYWSADVESTGYSFCLYFDGTSYSVDFKRWESGEGVRPVINRGGSKELVLSH